MAAQQQATNSIKQLESDTKLFSSVQSLGQGIGEKINDTADKLDNRVDSLESNLDRKFGQVDNLFNRAVDTTNRGFDTIDASLDQTNKLVSNLDSNIALGALKTEMALSSLKDELDSTRDMVGSQVGGLGDSLDKILLIGGIGLGGLVILQMNNRK